MNVMKALWSDEQGASLTEYALLLAVVTVGMLGAVIAMRDEMVATLYSIPADLSSLTSSGS